MVKSPQLFRIETTGFEFETEEIVGIVNGNTTISKYGHKHTADELEGIVPVGEGQVDAIIEAYERTTAAEPDSKEFINCHMFVYFALGRTKRLKKFIEYPASAGAKVEFDKTEPGSSYSTVTSEGVINHSLLGTGIPSKSLNVLGDDGPLMLMDNRTVADVYESKYIVKMDLSSLDWK